MALPSGYKRVEYIQSSGTQYIDTGFSPQTTSRVVMDISGVGKAGQILFGIRGTASATAYAQFVVYRTGDGRIRSDYFGSNKYADLADASARTIVDQNKNVMTAYGLTITNPALNVLRRCPYYLYLLALNNAGDAIMQCSAKVYSCQCYDDGVLVRDFIPCINASGTVGLYDAVNAVFYGNSGTGVFTAGPDVVEFNVAGYENVNGSLKKYVAGYENVNGSLKKILRGYQNVNGVLIPFDIM